MSNRDDGSHVDFGVRSSGFDVRRSTLNYLHVSRVRHSALVIVIWAVIYLPWLGSSGLRSEEGKLWRTGRLGDFLQPAHLLGILAALGIFAAWAIPYSFAIDKSSIAATWSSELASRFTGKEIALHDWFLNFLEGVGYFLPFGLLLPFIRFSKMPAPENEFARGLGLGMLVPFCFVLLMPGGMARYILPLLIPACWLAGMAVNAQAFDWRILLRGFQLSVSPKIVWALIVTTAVSAIIIFQARSATVQKERPGYDRLAHSINAAIPPGEYLYAVDPGYQPYFFYIHAPLRYVTRLDQLPANACYFVARGRHERRVARSGRPVRLLARTTKFRGEETVLYGPPAL